MTDLSLVPVESVEDVDVDGLAHYVCCAFGDNVTFCGLPVGPSTDVPYDAPEDDDCVVCLDLSGGGYVCPYFGLLCPRLSDPDPPGR